MKMVERDGFLEKIIRFAFAYSLLLVNGFPSGFGI